MSTPISVISGDLVDSRRSDTVNYLNELHSLLDRLQRDGQLHQVEIFRGDAFQAQAAPEDGLLLAVYIRLVLRAMGAAHWDARVLSVLLPLAHTLSTKTVDNLALAPTAYR